MPRLLPWPFALALLAGVAGACPAIAADPGDAPWRWAEGQTRTWLIEDHVIVPRAFWLGSPENLEARVARFEVRVVARCTGGAVSGGRSWQLDCALPAVALAGEPLPADAGLLTPVLQDLASLLRQANVRLRLDARGDLRDVELNGFPRDDDRLAAIHEMLRLMLARAFAGLDLRIESPAAVGLTWKQPRLTLVGYPDPHGAPAKTLVRNRTTGAGPDGIEVETSGRFGLMVKEPGAIGKLPMVGDLFSVATFDTVDGSLERRHWSVRASATPMMVQTALDSFSRMSDGRQLPVYVQGGRLERIPEGAPLPDVGESGEGVYRAGGPMDIVEEALSRSLELADQREHGPEISSTWLAGRGGVASRPLHAETGGVEVSAGIRTLAGWRAGLGIGAQLPAQLESGQVDAAHDLVSAGALAGVWWDPAPSWEPRIGALAMASLHSYGDGEPGSFFMGSGGPEVALLVPAGRRYAVGPFARGLVEFRRVRVYSEDEEPETLPPLWYQVGVSFEVRRD